MSHPEQNLTSQRFVPEVLQRPCDILVKDKMSDYTFHCPKPLTIKETIDGTTNRKLHPLTLENHFIRDGCLHQGAYIQYMVLPYLGNFRFILLAQFDVETPFVMYSYTLNARTLHCDVTFEFYEAKTFKAFGHTCNQVITLHGYLVDDQNVIVGQFYYPPFKFRSDRDGKTKRLIKDKSEIKAGDGKKKRLKEKVKSQIVRSSIEELEFLSQGPRSPEMDLQELPDSDFDLGNLVSPIESHETEWNSVTEHSQQHNETVEYVGDFESSGPLQTTTSTTTSPETSSWSTLTPLIPLQATSISPISLPVIHIEHRRICCYSHPLQDTT
jgi:hypothetical protein